MKVKIDDIVYIKPEIYKSIFAGDFLQYFRCETIPQVVTDIRDNSDDNRLGKNLKNVLWIKTDKINYWVNVNRFTTHNYKLRPKLIKEQGKMKKSDIINWLKTSFSD